MLLRVSILSVCFLLGVQSQENAGSSVAKSLIECYNNTELLERERRPSSSITVLIDLINVVESGPSLQSERLLSKEIIHKFKQDGIIKFTTSTSNPYSIPYTPKGMQSDKHKILLKKLIPGSTVIFPNETVNDLEKCSFHFMLSNSVDLWQRGDESSVCNKLGRYQRRVRRDSNPNDDVEIIGPSISKPSGNLQHTEMDEEEHHHHSEDQVDTEVFQEPNLRKSINVAFSDCPLENGAVYTRWGTVQAGTVIAGIAAGLEPQKIPTEENYVVDNIFGATLAGDLAEVGLHQGTSGKNTVTVGANGGWNGTQVPRWYFIQKNTDYQMTDAEIRGGLDGLIIGKNIKNWQSKASTLKLSQVLDMYYSPRGVFSKKFRACNRKHLFTEVASQKELTEQSIAFSFLLNEEAKLPGSITPEGIKAYGEKAVNALIEYITSLPDLTCEVEDDTISRASTDIIIVLDTAWSFNTVHKALAYLLDNLDINKYESNFTMINGKNGNIMVNSSSSLLDFYEQYNRTVHADNPNGFDVTQVFSVIEVMTKRKMDMAKISKNAGGQSSIVLFMPYGTLTGSDSSTANDRKSYFKKYLPDIKLLVLARTAQESYSDLVVDPASDAFSLTENTDGASITSSVNKVIFRVKQIPRRITNPNCGSTWSGGASSDSLNQYVEPNSTNYYRIASNYFFGEGTRSVKVRGSGIVACFSRYNERPSNNGTDDCKSISSSGDASFSLTDACKDKDEITQCPPAYLSIEAIGTGGSTNVLCTDNGCRFPDNIKYTIYLENFACTSGTYRIVGNIGVLIMALLRITFFF